MQNIYSCIFNLQLIPYYTFNKICILHGIRFIDNALSTHKEEYLHTVQICEERIIG